MSYDTLATELVGSYAKPSWLVDHAKPTAIDQSEWWRVPPERLREAQDDAVLLAIADQERAGLDYVTDGEQRRQSFSGYFMRLGGIDLEHWSDRYGEGQPRTNDVSDYISRRDVSRLRSGMMRLGPTVTGPITWQGPLSVGDLEFLRRHTSRRTKVTVIGPATLAVRVADQHYGDMGKLMRALADALNQEIRALEAAGADLIQIDDPEIHFNQSRVGDWATEALSRAVAGVTARTAVHICYGYAHYSVSKRVNPAYAEAMELIAASDVDEISIEYEQPGHEPEVLEHAGEKAVILGLLDLSPEAPVERAEHIIERARAALEVVPPQRLRLAPDCGMWFLPRDTAQRKIAALATAARALRTERGL